MKKELVIDLKNAIVNFCGHCGKHMVFEYRLDNQWWTQLIPLEEQKSAICLECLFMFFIRWIHKKIPSVRGEKYEEYNIKIKISTTDYHYIFGELNEIEKKLIDEIQKQRRSK